MYYRIKRFFVIFIVCMLTFSCDLEKAEKEYKKGNYVESMEIIFNYFDKNPGKLSKIKPKIQEDITSKFSNIISFYSQNSENSYDLNNKLKSNISLFQIYSLIEGREYAKNFEPLNDFMNKNNISTYFENAKKANNELFLYHLNVSKNYLEALKTTDTLLELEKFIDKSADSISAKPSLLDEHRLFKKEIAQIRSDNRISIAEAEEKNDHYRNAQNLYLEALQIYSYYEKNYKGSYDKYLAAKHKADLSDAEKNYNQGIKYYNRGNASRADLRTANSFFKKAYEYIPSYKDTERLILETEKGFFKYNIISNSSDFSSDVISAMQNIGVHTSVSPEIIFEYTEYTDYNTVSSNTETENLNERVQIGRDQNGNPVYENYYFTRKTVISKETIIIKYTFKVKGTYNNSISDSVTYVNNIKNISYSGKVPQQYKNTSENFLGKYELDRKARPELKKSLNSKLNSIINDLKKM